MQSAVPNLSARRVRIVAVSCALVMLALGIMVRAESPGSEVERMSTPERVESEPWWPTKLLASRKDYVGPEACVRCHASKASAAKDTEMFKALLRPEDSEVLQKRSGESFQLDSYLYELERSPQGHAFAVSRGSQSGSLPITWAFGDGLISQVYFTEYQGKFYESHFSYYGGISGFDRTTNQERPADSVATALGRVVSPDETRRCFVCHATAVTATGGYNEIVPGITCEACHGPGADHVAAMKSGVEGGEAMIMNPKHRDPTAQVDFCGACHETWVDVELGAVTGPPTIRFPAYGLLNSRCWGEGDFRITCAGCHDPHQPLVRDTAKYDEKCLACHVNRGAAAPAKDHPGRACPQADRDCASCHMPRQAFPSSHHSFTDHDIRIVRAGETAPS